MNTPLPLPSDDQLPVNVAQRLQERPPVHIYRMIANAPQCLIPMTDMVKALYESTIPARLREIAILRQAARAKAPYELHQHTLIARANGFTESEIAELTAPAPVTSFSDREKLVCEMCDQLESTATLDDATHERARNEFDTREFVEIILLIGFYCSVARFLNATRLPIEKNNPLEGATSPN